MKRHPRAARIQRDLEDADWWVLARPASWWRPNPRILAVACPACGAAVAPAGKAAHIAWHVSEVDTAHVFADALTGRKPPRRPR